MKELPKVQGIVQTIRDNRKGLKLNNVWYSSFMPLPDELELGDNIWLTYKEKGNFKNIQNFDYLETKETETETKAEPKKSSEILCSQLMSYSKDIFIALINNTPIGEKTEFNLDTCVDSVINQFKKIRDSLI